MGKFFFAFFLYQSLCFAEPRIAMFFAGRVTSYEETGGWIKEFIEKHSVDVFCSINGELDPYHQKFLDDFHVKRAQFERFQMAEGLAIKNSECRTYNFCSMVYNLNQCMQLILETQSENNFIYDIAIFMRADIDAKEPFHIETNIDEHTVYIPLNYDDTGINDQMAYGSVSTMAKYCSLTHYIDPYCNQEGARPTAEYLLKHHLNKLGLTVQRFRFDYVLNNNRRK